jgi:hypothetical protein
MEKRTSASNTDNPMDFGGHSPVHRRRLRPHRGLLNNDTSDDSDIENRNEPDALPSRTQNEIILPIPFISSSCATCLQQKKGDFILLNLNAAMHHARSHHCGVGVLYSCTTCGKTYKGKHAAQCHVPKCKGPSTGKGKTVICGLCNQAFKTQRGLSQHERLVHPVERNEKREKAVTDKRGRGASKGYGKVWQKDEVDTMIHLEKTLQGHPQIAKQMMEHLPGKTAKQIRDKRREPSYKALVETYKLAQGQPANQEPPESICSSSDSEVEIRPVTTRRYVSETEDEDASDKGLDSRHPGPSSPKAGQNDLAHERLTETDQEPGLSRSAGDGSFPSQENVAYHSHQVTRPHTQSSPIRAEAILSNDDTATPDEQQWQSDIIRQALAETRDTSTLASKCRDLHSRLVSILTDIGAAQLIATQALVDDVYAQVLAQIETVQATRAKNQARRKKPKTQAGRKRKKKRYKYARTQDLFRKNPNLLARYIREDVPWLEDEDSSSPKPEDVKSFYSSLWGATPAIHVPFSVTGVGRKDLELGEVFQAITARDINARLMHTRHNTASGPDGIQRKHIAGHDVKELLRILYNLILVSRIQPKSWNANRTILIPKQGKDRSRAENYRPLTIGSLICRTYWGIVDKKLREVISFSPRQKGFVHETGCFNNVHLLNETIRAAKKKDGLVAIQLDIAKAFDTVPHMAIDAALKRLGLPIGVRESIMNSYESLSTTIEYAGSSTEVSLKRGVKQGDPLSPFIFNAILDPLLEQLEEMKGYVIDESHSLSALAFADDLILLATTKDKAQSLLHHTESYLKNLGMRIAAEKCASFEIRTTKDSWFIANPDLCLSNGEIIPNSAADSSLSYLGGHISPWSGLHYKDLVAQLETTLERCRSAHLKPHQKLLLTTSHLIPHFLHKTVLATPPISTIRAMDQTIRNHVKVVLHLPMSTPNGLLYCSKRDGGLGVPKLEALATSSTLKQGITLLNSFDPATHALLQETKLEQRLQSLAKAMRLPWPIPNFKSIDAYKKRMKADELKNWSQLQSKGRGVASFKDDRNGNAWLYNPNLLKPSRFLTALRLRGGMTSDKVTMNKVVPQANVKCRKCKACNETLAHILGQCVYTKTQRIRRHDEIRDFVSKKLASMKEGIQIIEEALIETPTGNLKPDLVVVSQGRVHVVDVTVRHEDTGYLDEGYRSKVEKYTPLLEILASQLSVERGRVLPLVVGTRGSMPVTTIDSLREININDRGSYVTISLLALRHSIEIYHTFMDYNALVA